LASPFRNKWFLKAREKSGTLKWESEWKAICKNIVTRRAYKLNLPMQNIMLARALAP
jgi:hypothetical protein